MIFIIPTNCGAWPSGKAAGFGPVTRRFESFRPRSSFGRRKDLPYFYILEVREFRIFISGFNSLFTLPLHRLDFIFFSNGSPSLYYDDKPHIAIDPLMM